MKKILASLIFSATFAQFSQATDYHQSSDEKNHVLASFENDNCLELCEKIEQKINIYNPNNLIKIRFDDKKYKELHSLYASINSVEKKTQQHFLNYSLIDISFFEAFDIRELKDDIVGNIKLNINSRENKMLVSFEPLKKENYSLDLMSKINGSNEEVKEHNNSYDNSELSVFVAVSTPNKKVYINNGINEGKFISHGDNVIFLKSKKSTDYNWDLDIPFNEFNEGSLSLIVWIEDSKKNIIQATSKSIYRVVE